MIALQRFANISLALYQIGGLYAVSTVWKSWVRAYAPGYKSALLGASLLIGFQFITSALPYFPFNVFEWKSWLSMVRLYVWMSLGYTPTSFDGELAYRRDFCHPLHLLPNIISWHVSGGRPSRVIICCSEWLLPSCCIAPYTSSSTTTGQLIGQIAMSYFTVCTFTPFGVGLVMVS